MPFPTALHNIEVIVSKASPRSAQNVTIPYTPRPLQSRFHDSAKRFNVAVCHRRFGKTVMAINHLLKDVLLCPHPRAQGAYIAPTYTAAKRIAWSYLREYAGVIPGVRFNEAELRCDLPDDRRIYLLGGDSADNLRGLFLDSVCLDEFADMNSRLYPEVIRPAVSDREGKVLTIGTPRGSNQFKDMYDHAREREEAGDPDYYTMLFKASETGILKDEELESARAIMDESQYQQEFECSWSAALVGSYYGAALDLAETDNRVTNVPYDPNLKVSVSFDLGVADSTAIWFCQEYPRTGEVRLIDYYEASGEGLHHYVKELNNRPYHYDKFLFPHDIMVRELGSGSSRYEMLTGLGMRPSVVAKLKVQDGIEAVRALLPRCWFDRKRCAQGLKYLRGYHRAWDARRNDWRSRPNHDASSHSADSFRYLAVGLRDGDNNDDIKSMSRSQHLADGRPVIMTDYADSFA